MRPATSDSWSPDSSWHVVVRELLKFLLAVNWDVIPVEQETPEVKYLRHLRSIRK